MPPQKPLSTPTPVFASVLIVDDDECTRELSSVVLSEAGYRVFQAQNGAEGIREAHAQSPDIILMDLDMPVMGGLRAIQCLKEDSRTRDIPIVVLTGTEMVVEHFATALGANAFLTKPCLPERLEAVIRSLTPHGEA